MANSAKPKRYSLNLPEELFNEVQRVADERGTSVVDILRRFIKLGLLAVQIESDPDAQLLIREGEREQRLILL